MHEPLPVNDIDRHKNPPGDKLLVQNHDHLILWSCFKHNIDNSLQNVRLCQSDELDNTNITINLT